MHVYDLYNVTLAAQPMAPWNGTGLGSAEYTAHQFLRYIEESVTRASPAGITPSSVIEHFTSMLSSRQTELSAKVIMVVLLFEFVRLHMFAVVVNHL